MNAYLRVFILSSILILNTQIFASETETTYNFSQKAIEKVPDIVQKANSPNLNDRISILKKLVYKPPMMDVNYYYRFYYELPVEDYISAAKCVLNVGTQTREHEDIAEIFGRITYVAIELKATELLPQITKFIDNKYQSVQLYTLRILRELNAKQYTQEIIKAAYSSDLMVSRDAERILADFNSKEAVPLFISCLNDENQAKRVIAIEALGKIADPNAIPNLIQMLKTELSSQTINALVQMNAKESVPFIKELYNSDKYKNSQALVSLVYFGDEEAISDIMTKIVGSDNLYYESYLESLMKINARPIIPFLIKALEEEKIVGGHSDRGPNVVRTLMITLAKMNANEAIPTLRRYLKLQPVPSDVDDFLERGAIEALSLLKDKENNPKLLQLLDSKNDALRTEATMAMARIGELSTIESLIVALKKRKPDSRHVDVLKQLTFTLNPNIYKKLLNKFPSLEGMPLEEFIKQLNEKGEVKFSLSDKIPIQNEIKNRMVAGFSGPSGLDVIDRILIGVLNYSSHNYAIFIDNGVVRFVEIEEAYDLWENWADEYIKKHPESAN